MTSSNDKIYFSKDLNNRERACFEAGIKLGALYHILCGIPISSEEMVISTIERGIEAAISCQPYVKSVKIMLDRDKISGTRDTPYDYDEITGQVITAKLILNYDNVELVAKIDWAGELEYPLMYVESINEK